MDNDAAINHLKTEYAKRLPKGARLSTFTAEFLKDFPMGLDMYTIHTVFAECKYFTAVNVAKYNEDKIHLEGASKETWKELVDEIKKSNVTPLYYFFPNYKYLIEVDGDVIKCMDYGNFTRDRENTMIIKLAGATEKDRNYESMDSLVLQFHDSMVEFQNIYKNRNMHNQNACSQCGKERSDTHKLMKCSICHFAHYCNATCQKEHWPTHKKTCTKSIPILL